MLRLDIGAAMSHSKWSFIPLQEQKPIHRSSCTVVVHIHDKTWTLLRRKKCRVIAGDFKFIGTEDLDVMTVVS
ncbi:hypothetical protein ACROYT_G044047 [Oculina patagonica]